MKKINILVTALGGDIGGNVVNILSAQEYIKFNIIGTDVNKKVFNFDKVNKFYQVPKTDNANYKIQILQIIDENSIDIVLPISEREIIWFNNNISVFDSLKIKVIINNKNIIDKFLNKLETSKKLNEIFVKTPRTFLFSAFNNQLEFPVIFKGKSSITTKDIYIIKSQNQLNYLKASVDNHDDYIIQEYVGSIDEEYTTTVYQYNNNIEVISFKRKLSGGMTSFATITNEVTLNEYAKKIAKSLNLQGSINIQSRKVGREFYIFEINPRFSSTIYIRNHFGFQDLLWWIDDILDNNSLFLKQKNIALKGDAILGYQYKFFNEEHK